MHTKYWAERFRKWGGFDNGYAQSVFEQANQATLKTIMDVNDILAPELVPDRANAGTNLPNEANRLA